MKFGPNQLAVRVNNGPFDDIAQISGDFTVFGGLYRPVHLIETDALCISPLIDGAPGVRVESSDISASSAKVRITTDLSDRRTDRATPASVRTTILAADGKPVATATTPANAPAVTQELRIVQPRLWNGTADPHLYTVRVEVVVGGTVRDTVSQPLGLRTLIFDKQKGALLNGRPYRLLGVCRHQDRVGSEWALTEAEQDEDLAIIREMGANAVRLAHYPHSEYFHRICDRAGVLVWAEVPNVNEIRDTPEFTANARQQLREMIAQLGNHPSIFAWGLWNELGLNANPTALMKQLDADANRLDPSRPTTAAADGRVQEVFPDTVPVTDTIALNKYPGWYEGLPSGMNALLDNFQNYAAQPIGVSEYGAGASIIQHEQGRTRAPKAAGKWHPEEWQATVHEGAWAAIAKRPFVWGSFVWNMFDFASVGRNEGDLRNVNDKGLVTRVRKVRKDAFFFYKASWSAEPVLYITSRRAAVRVKPETEIKVYSNAEAVTVTFNGVKLPPAERDGVIHRWPGLTLNLGDNTAEASATRGAWTGTDKVVWTYDPTATIPLPPEEKKAPVNAPH